MSSKVSTSAAASKTGKSDKGDKAEANKADKEVTIKEGKADKATKKKEKEKTSKVDKANKDTGEKTDDSGKEKKSRKGKKKKGSRHGKVTKDGSTISAKKSTEIGPKTESVYTLDPILVKFSSLSSRPHDEIDPVTNVTIYNSYEMGPAFRQKFPVPYIRYMMERVFYDKLNGKAYNITEAAKWARDIVDEINLRMRGFCAKPRYKHVVTVMIFQQTGAGCCYGSSAVWDELSDDSVSIQHLCSTFIACCTVFGIYKY
ncbi:tctex1 domain-containing protein 1-B [Scaptodrosophila lebanonensis]|uniref:Tctex1 domain-containing protein 1-B n=1 Tax=Drosophila lebanonensis TaxID=7225 RepID=A0A6J2U019_DROLE|nr:tctex1 domain-containing protein 1-B [Scaptodrosophila lebanonensis]